MNDAERLALPEYVRALLDPAAYPHAPSRVDLVQTHISYVFLADDVVYKTKKPVNFGFIDQVAPEARERHCHAEVALNRRLAADVYLGVVAVRRRPDGRIAIDTPDGTGEVVEWAVKMRRLPETETLDRIIAEQRDAPGLAGRLAERLIAFHAAAATAPGGRAFAGAEGVRAWWARESGEAEVNIGGTWAAEDAASLRAFVAATLERDAAVFDARADDGRVVEGHGDLQAKHVYVLGPRTDDLVIVDCIEFSDWFQFRYQDVGYDLAFLAMDLEAQGRPDLADELAGRYLAASVDETLGLLQPLHRAFRAFVRGKVESIGARAEEVPAEQRAALAASAARYFRLASQFAGRRAAPSVLVMCGPSGTGKSTVSAAVAARVGAAYLSSDAVRKSLAGIPPHASPATEQLSALYGSEMNARTYEAMRTRAAAHLASGRSVVLDATHSRTEDRAAAVAIARAARVPVVLASLRLPDAAAVERIEGRRTQPFVTSDATPAVYREQVRAFEPVSAAEAAADVTVLDLDAGQPVAALTLAIAQALPRFSPEA